MSKEFCRNTKIIFNSKKSIWDEITNFYKWDWFSPIKEVQTDKNFCPNEIGANRIINKDFYESILDVDLENDIFKYAINNGPNHFSNSKISSFVGTVKLIYIEEEITEVIWKTSWNNILPNNLYKSTDIICKMILADLEIYLKNKL